MSGLNDTRPGYLNDGYAHSLSEFGRPWALAESGGWLLLRKIEGTPFYDAIGTYPYFYCRNWEALADDFAALPESVVSVAAVLDPFVTPSIDSLTAAFDNIAPYKTQYVVRPDLPLNSYTSSRHRSYGRRAQRRMVIEKVDHPLSYLEAWCDLYRVLSDRHGLSGIQAFSRTAFEYQLAIPGTIMFRAFDGDQTLGLDIWYEQGPVAHGHLVAISDKGYQLQAAYGLKLALIEFFRGRVEFVNLGGVPGVKDDQESGLAHFKRGWSSDRMMTRLCTRVLNQAHYKALCKSAGVDEQSDYFPAYRSPAAK